MVPYPVDGRILLRQGILDPPRKVLFLSFSKTRMHSRRMRTDRALTVLPYWKGVSHFQPFWKIMKMGDPPPPPLPWKMEYPSEKWCKMEPLPPLTRQPSRPRNRYVVKLYLPGMHLLRLLKMVKLRSSLVLVTAATNEEYVIRGFRKHTKLAIMPILTSEALLTWDQKKTVTRYYP